MLGQIPTGAKAAAFTDSKNALHTRIFEAFSLVCRRAAGWVSHRFIQVPVKQYEDCYAAIIPHIVADFVLADSASTATTNTLLFARDLAADSVLLGTGYLENDNAAIEDQLNVTAGAAAALEYDATVLALPGAMAAFPAPRELAACNAAILLFQTIFPVITSQKHRLQACYAMKVARLLTRRSYWTTSTRASAAPSPARAAWPSSLTSSPPCLARFGVRALIDVDVLSLMDAGIAQSKGSVGKDKLIAAVKEIVVSHLTSPEPVLRCAAANALGTLCLIVGAQFAQATLTQLFEKIQVCTTINDDR